MQKNLVNFSRQFFLNAKDATIIRQQEHRIVLSLQTKKAGACNLLHSTDFDF